MLYCFFKYFTACNISSSDISLSNSRTERVLLLFCISGYVDSTLQYIVDELLNNSFNLDKIRILVFC